MNYTTTSRELKARLKLAIKDGLPDWVLVHIERRMEYAKRKWEASRDKTQAKEDRDHWYSKAVNVLLGLHDLLGDFSRLAAAPAVPDPSPQPESAA